MMKVIFNVFLVLLVVGGTERALAADTNTATVEASTPEKEMQATIDQLVKVVEAYPGEENVEKRRGEMRAVIEPKFDFKEMAMRSLGYHWKRCTDEERAEFVDVFSDLLAKTYLNRIESIERGMVKIKSNEVRFPKALVRTSVTYKGDVFPLDYKLLNREGNWRVYDVIIENIGLVANYKNEFAGIIRKEKFAGLLKRLRKKLAA